MRKLWGLLILMLMLQTALAWNFEKGYSITIDETTTNVNSSEFWDALDTPADILGSLINNDLGWITASGGEPNWDNNFTYLKLDCPAGNYTYGVFSNGSLKCRNDNVGNNGCYNSSYVPYTGADKEVDLGNQFLKVGLISSPDPPFHIIDFYSYDDNTTDYNILSIYSDNGVSYLTPFDTDISPPWDLGRATTKFRDLYLSGTAYTKNLNATGNITDVKYIQLSPVSGACQLNRNGTICSNSSGTYIIG